MQTMARSLVRVQSHDYKKCLKENPLSVSFDKPWFKLVQQFFLHQ